MSQLSPVRVGIIGAGSIFDQRHFPGLSNIQGVELIAVSNRSEASSKAKADQWNIARIKKDWQAIIEASDIDAVMIGTWPYLHKEISIAALEAGKHVFCQARMAMNLDEAYAMIAAAEKAPSLVNMVCPPPIRMPYEPFLKQLLSDGVLGDIREIELRVVNGAGLGPLTWRERVEHSGQQTMLVGIWAEALEAWFGPYETLSASTSTPISEKLDETGEPYTIDIPQIVYIHGTLAQGPCAGVPIIEHHSSVSPNTPTHHLHIIGSEKVLRISIVDFHMQLSIADVQSSSEFEPIEVPKSLTNPWQVEEDFIRAVRLAQAGKDWHLHEPSTINPTFHDALGYMQKVDAMHRSAATGRAVTLTTS